MGANPLLHHHPSTCLMNKRKLLLNNRNPPTQRDDPYTAHCAFYLLTSVLNQEDKGVVPACDDKLTPRGINHFHVGLSLMDRPSTALQLHNSCLGKFPTVYSTLQHLIIGCEQYIPTWQISRPAASRAKLLFTINWSLTHGARLWESP